MRQFDFATDIEERNPWTGNVYFVDRMTSDWAERHPLNVDQFIEDVYREFEGTEFEEQREELRRVWTATFGMPAHGDASLYPNRNGAHRPAAMKVWMTAGDYWRRGFRMGDVLPERLPGHRITRLPEGGWISLFPKDMHLIENGILNIENSEATPVIEPEKNQAAEANSPCQAMDTEGTGPIVPSEIAHVAPVPAVSQAEPDGRDEEIVRLQARIAELEAKAAPVVVEVEPVVVATQPTERERNAAARQRRREQREAQRRSYEERLAQEAAEAEAYARQQERRKIIAAVGAAAVTLVMIYFFGLLGPAVFGLLAGGLLKG